VRYRSNDGPDVEVAIPVDRAGGTLVARTSRAVRWLWSRGIYPGPAAVNLRLRGRTNSSRTLSGRETRTRNALLVELGIPRLRRDRRFELPR